MQVWIKILFIVLLSLFFKDGICDDTLTSKKPIIEHLVDSSVTSGDSLHIIAGYKNAIELQVFGISKSGFDKMPVFFQVTYVFFYHYMSFILAIFPGAVILLAFYITRKHRRERLLKWLTLFIAGSLAIIPAYFIEGAYHVGHIANPTFGRTLFDSFIAISFTEEFLKFLVFMILGYYSPQLINPYKGMIYCLVISMGFATVENFMYIYNYGVLTGLGRLNSAVPAHACFGIIMGFFAGLAKFSRFKLLFLILSLATAVFFHGLYDFFILQQLSEKLKIFFTIVLFVSMLISALAIYSLRLKKDTDYMSSSSYLIDLVVNRVLRR